MQEDDQTFKEFKAEMLALRANALTIIAAIPKKKKIHKPIKKKLKNIPFYFRKIKRHSFF